MLDIQTLWKDLGPERRLAAARAFYQDAALKDFHNAANTLIARHKNFRPPFVKRLPEEKRASYLAILPIPQDFISQLLVSYHFAHQRPMMSEFLNALNISNKDGLIDEDIEVTAPDAELLRQAAERLRSTHAADDANIYFTTLAVQNPEVWGGLAAQLPAKLTDAD